MQNNTNRNIQAEPVHDEICEKLVIGTLIQNRKAFEDNIDILDEECFENWKIKTIFKAIRDIHAKGEEADLITIPPYIEKIETGYKMDITELIELTNGFINIGIREKCLYLKELSKRRKLLNLGYKLINAGTTQNKELEEIIDNVNSTIDHINDNSTSEIDSIDRTIKQLSENIEANRQSKENIYDYSGIKCFDDRAFLRPKALTVIAAYSGHGKSCMATSIAYNCAKNGSPIAYYSMEMSKMELTARIISHKCETPTSKLLYGKLNSSEETKYREAILEIGELPIYFDERSTVSAETLYMSIRKMVRQKKVHGVIIDYLQILSQNNRQRNITEEAFLGGVVRNLKNIANQEGIWIILLSQISRNHETDEPKESYLRGSGQILEGCDNCALLYRPSKIEGGKYSGTYANIDPEGTAEINICKARNGSDGKRYITGFNPEYTYFFELDELPKRKNSYK